jgi:diaminohydroxyphosphoribosylaminopyrimidine deaminase/5-amino-6-(5-phosphoribosylamino)uracil reductase
MSRQFATDEEIMRYALALAARGVGRVEPNPPVGAVLVDRERRLLGEGWHERFGGPHAEVFALQQAGSATRGSTLFVTLEPCCHFGKTPPCTRAIVAAGVARVVAAVSDPAPQVAGQGLRELRRAGVDVEVGLLEHEARRLLAPFFKLILTARPWVHAKWAMTCDGKLATRTGHSQWISGSASRAVVHQLRGRMDALVVGRGTVVADDPLLTARPAGPRTATRVVLDRQGRLPLTAQVVRTARDVPTLCVVGPAAPAERLKLLQDHGVEVLPIAAVDDFRGTWPLLLAELGRRRMTHVLIEGGSQVFGSAFDADVIDEWHVFIAPKVVGGAAAPSPLAGIGREAVAAVPDLVEGTWQWLGDDAYLHGYTRRSTPPENDAAGTPQVS